MIHGTKRGDHRRHPALRGAAPGPAGPGCRRRWHLRSRRMRSPKSSRASRSTGATCPIGAESGGSLRIAARAAARTWPPRSATLLPLLLPDRVPTRTGRALPADLRHGDGQGRGGHRVLPLHPAGHADRGGRRPHRVRACPPDDSTPGWPPAGTTLPLSMTTLTTHDTKRSEDTRARISVLAELAARWRRRWTAAAGLAPLPDGPLANLLWQAVAGAWPADRERLQAYAQKAAREAGNSHRLDRTRTRTSKRKLHGRRGRGLRRRRRCAAGAGCAGGTAGALRPRQRPVRQAGPARPCPACRTSTRAPNSGTGR